MSWRRPSTQPLVTPGFNGVWQFRLLDGVLQPDEDLAGSVVVGTPGDDVLVSTLLGDTISAGDGDDRITGSAAADSISADGGNDTATGGRSDDVIWGGDGDDSLTGGDGQDTIAGGAGADTIDGGPGYDLLTGGAMATIKSSKTTTMAGATTRSKVVTGTIPSTDHAAADLVAGQSGDDVLNGGFDRDTIYGGDRR